MWARFFPPGFCGLVCVCVWNNLTFMLYKLRAHNQTHSHRVITSSTRHAYQIPTTSNTIRVALRGIVHRANTHSSITPLKRINSSNSHHKRHIRHKARVHATKHRTAIPATPMPTYNCRIPRPANTTPTDRPTDRHTSQPPSQDSGGAGVYSSTHSAAPLLL